jgi:hypothetical protein
VIERKLAKLAKGRERFIPSKTIRSMIRHGHMDQLERFTVDGVQAISVEGQNRGRLGKIAWMVWTGTLETHLEQDHGGWKFDPSAPRSNTATHEDMHGQPIHLRGGES